MLPEHRDLINRIRTQTTISRRLLFDFSLMTSTRQLNLIHYVNRNAVNLNGRVVISPEMREAARRILRINANVSILHVPIFNALFPFNNSGSNYNSNYNSNSNKSNRTYLPST